MGCGAMASRLWRIEDRLPEGSAGGSWWGAGSRTPRPGFSWAFQPFRCVPGGLHDRRRGCLMPRAFAWGVGAGRASFLFVLLAAEAAGVGLGLGQ